MKRVIGLGAGGHAKVVIEILQQEVVAAEEILPGMEYIKGIVKQADGMIHILDIDSILSFGEIKSLDYALEEGIGGKNDIRDFRILNFRT